MTDFSTLLQSGNAWLFIPSALLLGALHGLEPGHSKTMMAAFIIAIRGTVWQAVLLGLAATISHTAIVWAIALAGLYFGSQFNTAATEPYLQIVSAIIIIGVALWMLWMTWQSQREHSAAHGHHHGDETRTIDTGHGILKVEVYEDGVPPRWRIRSGKGEPPTARSLALETTRPDGAKQFFTFVSRGEFIESVEEIPEPHQFKARVTLSHGDHGHSYDLEFSEHHHDHSTETGDSHERAHAADIQRRFAGQQTATTGQIVLFGLTGGLIPCLASITVLLLCLQLKKFALGATLVACFSIGLAVTMVAVGAAAALSVKHVSSRWSGFETFARRAPCISSLLIIAVGLYTGYIGVSGLMLRHT